MDYKMLIILLVLLFLLILVYRELSTIKDDLTDNVKKMGIQFQNDREETVTKLQNNMIKCVSQIKGISSDNLNQLRKITMLNNQPISRNNHFTETDDSEVRTDIYFKANSNNKYLISEQSPSYRASSKKDEFYMSESDDNNSSLESEGGTRSSKNHSAIYKVEEVEHNDEDEDEDKEAVYEKEHSYEVEHLIENDDDEHNENDKKENNQELKDGYLDDEIPLYKRKEFDEDIPIYNGELTEKFQQEEGVNKEYNLESSGNTVKSGSLESSYIDDYEDSYSEDSNNIAKYSINMRDNPSNKDEIEVDFYNIMPNNRMVTKKNEEGNNERIDIEIADYLNTDKIDEDPENIYIDNYEDIEKENNKKEENDSELSISKSESYDGSNDTSEDSNNSTVDSTSNDSVDYEKKEEDKTKKITRDSLKSMKDYKITELRNLAKELSLPISYKNNGQKKWTMLKKKDLYENIQRKVKV